MPGIKDRLIDAAYGLGWSVVCRVPESWARRAFMTAAEIAWRRQGPRVQVLEGDVRIVFDHLAAGRGVVFALPHMGNWDQAGAWIINRGAGSFTTVAERIKPESVYERFVAFREGLGMEVLPASGGSRPFGVLAQRLRAGKIVCLPCDRDVTGSGIEVGFFGEKARMMAGPAALAVQTGAALIPVTLWFDDDGWGVRFHAEIPVPAEGDRKQRAAAMTQQIAHAFEEGISAHPADWHMLQRVFVADLDAGRLAASVAAAEAADASAGTAAGAEPAAEAEPGPGAAAGASTWESASSARTPGTSPAACRSTSGTSPRR